MTVYEYDDDGRMVRSVTTHDPLFTDDDADLALDRAVARDAACPTCGVPRDEAWLPSPEDLEGLSDEERGLVLAEVEQSVRRHRAEVRLCMVCDQAQRVARTDDGAEHVVMTYRP